MEPKHDNAALTRVAALEHLTGPSRGSATWIGTSDLGIYLSSNQIIRATKIDIETPEQDLIAQLHPTEETYRIDALPGHDVWVNGEHITTRTLQHSDMIEFGDSGPMSRFVLYRENASVYKTVADILSDGIAYLKVSRQPFINRVFRVIGQLLRRLTQETTVMFRTAVIASILVLAIFVYQQNRLNNLLQRQIEFGTARLDNFTAAVARARQEALTLGDLKALRRELGQRMSSNAERLEALEQRSKASGRVIAQSMYSVAFIQGAYGFQDRSSGQMLRHVVGNDGQLMISPMGRPLLSLDGDGPVAERQFTGTGFSVRQAGALVTNRHVALPWEEDSYLKALAGQGLEPTMIKLVVYLPNIAKPVEVELVMASKDADLAVLLRKDKAGPTQGLKLAKTPPSPGDEIIVMGYPTGLRSMLAQSGAAFVEELQKTKNTGFWSVAARLAEANQIAPLSSRGIVGQVTPATIVYDAETTLGGSGGPVLDINGSVVAVNTAVLPEYGGSNLGVPVAKVRALLKDAGLQ